MFVSYDNSYGKYGEVISNKKLIEKLKNIKLSSAWRNKILNKAKVLFEALVNSKLIKAFVMQPVQFGCRHTGYALGMKIIA